jgi:hypothetical protein
VPRRQRVQDGGQVSFHLLRIQPAQPVVGAEFDDRRISAIGQHPVQARPATGGGIARHRPVDDRDRLALPGQGVLQARLKPIRPWQSEAGGQ